MFVTTKMPSLDRANAWINSEPLTPEGLRGQVVLVEFWTYTCINWLRTLPYTRAWAHRYRGDGLTVLGVHTPEFSIEHDVDSIRREVARRGIDWPVAVDSDYGVWQAFSNHYWPALYFVDRDGSIRHHHFGEGQYEESERKLQELLGVDHDDLVDIEGEGDEAPADWGDLRSPETYVGSARGEGFVGVGDAAPRSLGLNDWALTGRWTVLRERAVLDAPGGSIVFRFHARDVHLVLAPATPGQAVRFRVTLDGERPGDAHGGDVDADGNGTVVDGRLYQLVRQPGDVQDRTFAIEFLDAGVGAYVFTFG